MVSIKTDLNQTHYDKAREERTGWLEPLPGIGMEHCAITLMLDPAVGHQRPKRNSVQSSAENTTYFREGQPVHGRTTPSLFTLDC